MKDKGRVILPPDKVLHVKKATRSGRCRIYFMDEMRGFAVLCMIFYHAFFTFAYLYNQNWGKVLLNFFMPAEPIFAGLFILISGISSDLSRSNLKRGLKLLMVALAVTLVTVIVVPNEAIYFGILHFLSVCMILFGMTKLFFSKIPFWFGIVCCGLLYFLTMGISNGYIGFGHKVVLILPAKLYTVNWLAPLGIYSGSFSSADYFPLFPWMFVFLAGTFLGRFAAAGKFPKFTYRSHLPSLSFMGRHALIIYIVHQPIIYGVAWLLALIVHHI